MKINQDVLDYIESPEFRALSAQEQSDWKRDNPLLLPIEDFFVRNNKTVWDERGHRHTIAEAHLFSGTPVFQPGSHREDDEWVYPFVETKLVGAPEGVLVTSQINSIQARALAERAAIEACSVNPLEPCEDFDCAASVAGFNFNGGNLNNIPCGTTVSITAPWVRADGTRAEDNQPPASVLTANGVPVPFNSAQALSNTWSYTIPSTPGPHTVVFEWGNTNCPELCSLALTFDCVANNKPATVDSPVFPDYQPGVALPTAIGQSVLEPNTGVTITKISNEKKRYSRSTVVNANTTKFMETEGATTSISDISDLSNIGSPVVIPSNSEAFFDLVNPNIVWGLFGGQFGQYNCATQQLINSGVSAQGIGPFENILSENGCVVLFDGTNYNAYDMSNPASPGLLGSIVAPQPRDWAGFSRDGDHIAVRTEPGVLTCYDRNFNPQGSPITFGDPGHSDFGVDCDGNQVIAYVTDNGSIGVKNFDGADYVLPYTNVGNLGHISGIADGWLIVSVVTNFGSGEGLIARIKLCDGVTEYQIWSDDYTSSNQDPDQPQPSALIDGTGYVFWHSGNGGCEFLVRCV